MDYDQTTYEERHMNSQLQQDVRDIAVPCTTKETPAGGHIVNVVHSIRSTPYYRSGRICLLNVCRIGLTEYVIT